MKFLTLALFTVAALAEAVQKRGAQQNYASPAAVTYSKLQQPLQKTIASAAPQPQYYSQAAPATYSIPQQIQYQPQQLSYAQSAAVGAAPLAKAPVYRIPYSQANDVSSFQYSSPLVSYNNLGLLSQIVGRLATAPAPATKAAAAPVSYQAPQQGAVTYSSAAPVSVPRVISSQAQQQAQLQQYYSQAPQQYVSAQPQAAYQSSQSFAAQPASQAYATQEVPQTYSAQAAPQSYAAQSAPQISYSAVPQSAYSQAPQYYTRQGGVTYSPQQ